MCGHYPYAIQWKGQDLSDKDKEWLEATDYALYNPDNAPIFEQVKKDVQNGVWQPMTTIPKYEK